MNQQHFGDYVRGAIAGENFILFIIWKWSVGAYFLSFCMFLVVILIFWTDSSNENSSETTGLVSGIISF